VWRALRPRISLALAAATQLTDVNVAVRRQSAEFRNRARILRGALPRVRSGLARSFTYDSLRRLKQVNNAEGPVSYTYDNDSNVSTKTDGRNRVITYGYDEIDRRVSAVYDKDPGTPSAPSWGYDTPNATWCYDVNCGGNAVTNGLGRLVESKSSASDTAFTSFDGVGRVTASSQTTGATGSYLFPNYSYDLSGHLTSEAYPSGRVVNFQYDTAGRVNQVSAGSKNYASNVLYAPHGPAKSISYYNGLKETAQFNTRLQTTQISLGTAAAPTSVWNIQNCYASSDNMGCVAATANNGNLQQQMLTTIEATQTYGYDPLNRLTGASETIGGVGTWSRRMSTISSGIGECRRRPARWQLRRRWELRCRRLRWPGCLRTISTRD